jgi:hypothetical protein
MLARTDVVINVRVNCYGALRMWEIFGRMYFSTAAAVTNLSVLCTYFESKAQSAARFVGKNGMREILGAAHRKTSV